MPIQTSAPGLPVRRAGPQRPRTSAGRAARLLLACLAALAWAQPARALDPSREMRSYRLDRWGNAEGLHQTYILAILQRRDGYVWIGSKGGLSRFDGVRFASFDDRTPGQLGDSEVWAIVEDRDSTLWIATYGGGLSTFRDGRFRTFTERDGLASDFVTSLCLARDGTLWIGTLDGLSRYRDGRFASFRVQDGLPHRAVTALREDGLGRIWIGTRHGLVLFDPGRQGIRTLPWIPSITQPVRALCDGADGSIWVATTGEGLFRLQGETAARYTTREGLSSDSVGAVYVDSHGVAWVGTAAGLDRLAHGTVANWQPSMGASPLANIFALQGDREGNLWIGTASDGLAKLSDGAFITYTTRDGLPDDYLQAVVQDRQGDLWIGTIAGLSRFRGNRFTTFGARDGLSNLSVRAIAEDAEGTLWVGTRRGLHFLKNGKLGRTSVNGLDAVDVTALAVAKDGSLWVGTYERGVVHLARGACTFLDRQNGLPGNAVRSITTDRDGGVWVGLLDAGLVRIRDGRVTSFTTAQGLTSNAVYTVYEAGDGHLWVTTRRGLNRIRNDRIDTIPADGLPASFIYQMLEDNQGFTWLTSGQGIFRVRTVDLNARADGRGSLVPSTRYDTRDGIGSATSMVGTQPTAWRDREGRLWFALIRGLAVADPASFKGNPHAPPVVVEEVRFDDRAIPVVESASFPPGRGDLEIHYTGLSFSDPTKVRFRYQLEGFDPAWVDADTRRAAYYTNLAPGTYRFRVMACNNDGVWNQAGTSLSFTLEPRFRQTRTFRALAALVLLLAGGGAYRLRVRHLRRSNTELSRIVASRTAELAQANEHLRADMIRLERTVTENERLEEQVRQSQKMESVGRLAGGVAHDFNNHLTVITGYCEMLLSELPPDDPRAETVSQILAAGTRAAELTRQLLAFSRKQLMEPRAVNINDVLGETERMLRRLVGEHIELETRLSADLGAVMADPGQIGQVLTNLVVNARDAMPSGGTITIETRNVDLDAAAAANHPDSRPGRYVLLGVTDTGVGMDRATIGLIFEPFFTTKTKGSGTGLGLATTYGIVRQSNGFIEVRSEPGRGASFQIFLPRIESVAEPLLPQAPPRESLQGHETVLLVEDHEDVRRLAASALRAYGYRVLEASDGESALGASAAHAGPIDLLVTDVVMPGMTGRELAEQLVAIRPTTRVLYMSGYTADVIAHQGVLDPGVHYLSKPFTPVALAAKAREVLSIEPSGQGVLFPD